MFVSHSSLVSPTLTIGYSKPMTQHRQTETPTAFNSHTTLLSTPPQIFCYAFTSVTNMIPFFLVLLQYMDYGQIFP